MAKQHLWYQHQALLLLLLLLGVLGVLGVLLGVTWPTPAAAVSAEAVPSVQLVSELQYPCVLSCGLQHLDQA
jgi:hypothetical protein